MAQQIKIPSISELCKKHSSGELKLGDSVTLEGLTVVEMGRDPWRLVVRDFRRSKLVCFVEDENLLGAAKIGYLSVVDVRGTYYPSSPGTNDEFFKIYEITKAG